MRSLGTGDGKRVGRLSADCRSTVGRQSADSRPTVDRRVGQRVGRRVDGIVFVTIPLTN